MGACHSCLGQRDKDTYDEQEENRLLYDDDNAMQYGSFAEGHGGDDSVEAQRENEALQQVVAKTSSNMVDIFEIAPQQPNGRQSTGFGYAGQGARVARYQHLVSKLSSEDVDQAAGIKIDWYTEDDSQNERPMSLKTLDHDDGALVGTFADAAAAMKRFGISSPQHHLLLQLPDTPVSYEAGDGSHRSLVAQVEWGRSMVRTRGGRSLPRINQPLGQHTRQPGPNCRDRARLVPGCRDRTPVEVSSGSPTEMRSAPASGTRAWRVSSSRLAPVPPFYAIPSAGQPLSTKVNSWWPPSLGSTAAAVMPPVAEAKLDQGPLEHHSPPCERAGRAAGRVLDESRGVEPTHWALSHRVMAATITEF
ncbi:hypothetical protein A9K55_004618 [Cordyceps militaris]|uniref:Uncharacterized protein n=1 Tax=Cordyceps militaris TaxID=73501 RepID=A0A2H4SLH6_CORMI|nr:hypothetical protein A9K55_004618 [Cordyceps militaris]